jgi:hypothetical protein
MFRLQRNIGFEKAFILSIKEMQFLKLFFNNCLIE